MKRLKQGGAILLEGFEVCILLAIFGVISLAVWATIEESRQWNKFVVEHKCRVTAKMTGDTFNTIDARGNVGIGSTPGKTGWTCDDGITYYRIN